MKGALIGCGFFAENQLHAWRAIDGVEIVALCDRDPERLKLCSDTFDIARTYQNANDMLADGGFDFVDIATTVTSHRPLVEAAAKAGLHIICQKPLAETMQDARAMVAAAKAAGKVMMVHENFRWQSPIQAALAVVQSGKIGAPFFCRFSFRSGYDVFSGQPYLAKGQRFIIEDLGIHILDIARAFAGDVATMTATTRRINPAINGEDVATMMLAHDNGVTSIVDCSYATKRMPEAFPQTLLEIDGTAGSLKLDLGYKMTVQTQTETVTDVTPPLFPWAQTPWHNIQQSVQTLQQHFIDCLIAGRTPDTSGADNLKTLALVEAAYRSASTGRSVQLADI
jgi:predicted dehydrogenase